MEKKKPFSPEFLRKYALSDAMSSIVHEFVTGHQTAGESLSHALEQESLSANDRKAALSLLTLCFDEESKHGLVSVLRTQHLKGYTSQARKMMFLVDFTANGPKIQ